MIKILKESEVLRTDQNSDKWGFGKLDIMDGAYSIEAQEIPTQFSVVVRDNKYPRRRLMLRLGNRFTAPEISRLFNAMENESIESVSDLIQKLEYHSGYEVQKVR